MATEHYPYSTNALSSSDESSSDTSSITPDTPRFSRLLNSVLGSPFLTTSDLPFPDDVSVLQNGDYEQVDGAFHAVPRSYTVTRPSSPAPSFRTETYSIVSWTDHNDVFSVEARPSLSDAAPKCSFAFRSSPTNSHQAGPSNYYTYLTPATPFNTVRSSNLKSSRSFNLLPKLWDALRESSPSKKGKRRVDLTASIWNELQVDGYIDYANLPPLDGEEGELIDDEACFIDVRAVTGVDVIALLPEEVALYIMSFLEFPDILSCLSVSRVWRRFAQDNLIWRDLFKRRQCDGWDVDLRRLNFTHTVHNVPRLNWHELYKARTELDRRWSRNVPLTFSPQDKEKVTKLEGHTDSVYCLEFDSTKIITGSRDRTIKVWSLKTGACMATFSGHNGSVLCLKFDKDWELDESSVVPGTSDQYPWRKGFMVSGSSDCSVCVWNLYSCPMGEEGMVVTGELRGVLRGHSGGVLDLRIDSRYIISCSKDALIRVWDRNTLALHRTFRGHEGPVNALGLEGDKVVSASGDGKILLWDIPKGTRLRTFEGHDRGLACIEFKGNLIVSGSNDCKIKVWDAESGECVRTLTGHESLVRALAFENGSGRLVSASYDRTVKVWDLRAGKMVREFKGCHTSHIFDVKFDSCRIVSTSHDRKVAIVDLSNGLDASLFV